MNNINIDFRLSDSQEDVISEINATEIDANEYFGKIITKESNLLSSWVGINVRILESNEGTCAYSCNLVIIDRTELNHIFNGFTNEKYRTALFFALAHEYGHIAQFK